MKTRNLQKQSSWTQLLITVTAMMILMSGCAGYGPHTVSRDRFNYVTALSNSWKEQTLLNLVKTRYADAPVYMEIASVISQYAVESQFQMGTSLADRNTQAFGAYGKYTDRPTITYNPIVGEKFTRSMMTPIPTSAILSLVQTGYPVDYVLRICVNTINGLSNRFGSPNMGRLGDPEFYELLELMRQVQSMGGMGMRVNNESEKNVVVLFFRPLTDKALIEKVTRIKSLLGLSQQAQKFEVLYGAYPAKDTEITILCRPMLQVMIEFASYIDVPQSDLDEGRVGATFHESTEITQKFPPLIRVKNDFDEPDDAFVSVEYRDRYYWIEDKDIHSKSLFSFLMILFSLTERGGGQGAPIVTVPTN